MTEHKRLFNLLQMIALLSRPGGLSVDRLAKRFQVTTRTIYRYFDILRECGFEIEKSGQRRRLKHSSGSFSIIPMFTSEEAAVIDKAILSLHASHPQKSGLLKKLKIMTDVTHLADIIVDAKTASNVGSLIVAIREQKRVILHHYQSPNSDSIDNRKADPLGFTANMKYLYAFDPDHQKVLLFKPERIGRVEITGTNFKPDHRYHIEKPDLFGMNGKPETKVTLHLNLRALHLLFEEFPESRNVKDLRDIEPDSSIVKYTDIPQPIEVRLPVKGFEGVGRFVLGLPGEAVPLGPSEFLNYLQERNKRGIKSLQVQKSFERNIS